MDAGSYWWTAGSPQLLAIPRLERAYAVMHATKPCQGMLGSLLSSNTSLSFRYAQLPELTKSKPSKEQAFFLAWRGRKEMLVVLPLLQCMQGPAPCSVVNDWLAARSVDTI